LVGPSTAVTPAPGAHPFENVGAEEEKAIFYEVSASQALDAHSARVGTGFAIRTRARLEVFHNATHSGRGLNSGTSPERIAPESLTRTNSGFVHRNISR